MYTWCSQSPAVILLTSNPHRPAYFGYGPAGFNYQLMCVKHWLLKNMLKTEWAHAQAQALSATMKETRDKEVLDVLGSECARSLQLLHHHKGLHKALSTQLVNKQVGGPFTTHIQMLQSLYVAAAAYQPQILCCMRVSSTVQEMDAEEIRAVLGEKPLFDLPHIG
jgi:hypothetical protein